MRTVILFATTSALLVVGCAAERDELRYKPARPHGDVDMEVSANGGSRTAPVPSAAAPAVVPDRAVANKARPSVAARSDGGAPSGVSNVTSATEAAARAREAARRAAEEQRSADRAARDALDQLQGASEALRRGDAAEAAAAAGRAGRDAAQAEAAAGRAERLAADARGAAATARATAPETTEGTRLQRQSADAESHATRSSQAARRAADRARATATEATAIEALAAGFGEERRAQSERVETERTKASEADALSSEAEAAALEALRHATDATQWEGATEVAEAAAAARAAAERASAAARVLDALATNAQDGTTGARLREEVASLGGASASAAEKALEDLQSTAAAHQGWLSEVATIAKERLARVDEARDQIARMEAKTSSGSPLDGPLPTVPALPPERLPRPTGITASEHADVPRTPDVGRFRQVDGGNAADWLPGGYTESSLTLRADGVLEMRRLFPGQVEIVWRVGYAWSEDKVTLVVGEEEATRPPPRALQGFNGGATPAVTPLPARLACRRLADGQIRVGDKTYAPAD